MPVIACRRGAALRDAERRHDHARVADAGRRRATRVWRVDMRPGQAGPAHGFDVEQVWTVLDGGATLAGRRRRARARARRHGGHPGRGRAPRDRGRHSGSRRWWWRRRARGRLLADGTRPGRAGVDRVSGANGSARRRLRAPLSAPFEVLLGDRRERAAGEDVLRQLGARAPRSSGPSPRGARRARRRRRALARLVERRRRRSACRPRRGCAPARTRAAWSARRPPVCG